jgi:uncharacterized protein YndB with AHSA1/START domain
MPEILHRISIDAPCERVHDLVSTTEGIGCWWAGRPAKGDASVGGRFAVYFGDSDAPAATFTMESSAPTEVVWRVTDGPDTWIGTSITFALRPAGDTGTTLLFTHAGWADTSEFMHGCSTNWGAYLTSLKTGAEGDGFHPFPEGEISRWD